MSLECEPKVCPDPCSTFPVLAQLTRGHEVDSELAKEAHKRAGTEFFRSVSAQGLGADRLLREASQNKFEARTANPRTLAHHESTYFDRKLARICAYPAGVPIVGKQP